jgi:glycine/D-amino acid oxidase-like deaminating enzyme
MSQKILIVGAGFAGVWGALGAARVLDRAGVTAGAVDIKLSRRNPNCRSGHGCTKASRILWSRRFCPCLMPWV